MGKFQFRKTKQKRQNIQTIHTAASSATERENIQTIHTVQDSMQPTVTHISFSSSVTRPLSPFAGGAGNRWHLQGGHGSPPAVNRHRKPADMAELWDSRTQGRPPLRKSSLSRFMLPWRNPCKNGSYLYVGISSLHVSFSFLFSPPPPPLLFFFFSFLSLIMLQSALSLRMSSINSLLLSLLFLFWPLTRNSSFVA